MKALQHNRPSVAAYLSAQLDVCGKTQREIAEKSGFANTNIITMLKTGRTKLPIARIGPLSKALGVDPLYLYSLAMSEYEPATWQALQELVLKQPLLTANELEIIEIVRQSGLINPKVRTAHQKKLLLAAIDGPRHNEPKGKVQKREEA